MMTNFHIAIRSPDLNRELSFSNGNDFSLGDGDLDAMFRISVPKRERDLLRLMMGIYIADRLVRRPRRRQETTGSREIELDVAVSQPDFWNDCKVLALLSEVIGSLSNDFWSFRFEYGHTIDEQLSFPLGAQRVCQYSGGLDSAAGLCHELNCSKVPVLAVTAAHQSFHGKLRAQLQLLSSHFGIPVQPILCRTRLARPPKIARQETTQRLRSALFTALSGGVASAVSADTVDIFENGVGAINLPPQFGMSLGAMSTRGCQPRFLKAMGRLMSCVAGRRIEFRLPMLRMTKAEAVRGLAGAGLAELIPKTMSCVHWPLRNDGPAKHCGVCFACIARRQAIFAAGVSDKNNFYEVDIFGHHDNRLYENSKLLPLKACLMQVVDLRRFCDGGSPPHGFHQYLADAGIPNSMMTTDEAIDLHRRYAMEWQPALAKAKVDGIRWASWVKSASLAA